MKKDIEGAISHITSKFLKLTPVLDGDGAQLYKIGTTRWNITVDAETLKVLGQKIAEVLDED